MGIHETGIGLKDIEGNRYTWNTRNYNSELFFMGKGTSFEGKATVISRDSIGIIEIKNLRIIKS